MDSVNTVCPVCTLFLRPGITLKEHLSSHPKYKVIEALVKLASVPDCLKESNTSTETGDPLSTSQVNTAIVNNQLWNQPIPGHLGLGSNSAVNPVQGNHVFIYQQSMSTTTPQGNVLNVNPLSQQYVYPTVFNPQMMPYVYQQQQVIMSSNSLPPNLRALPPFELPNATPADSTIVTSIEKSATEVLDNDADNNIPVENVDDDEEISDEPELVEEACEVLMAKHESRLETKNPLEVETMEDFEQQQQDRYDEIPPDSYSSDPEDIYDNSCVRSPQSHVWNLHSELNKACQTHNNSPKSQVQDDEDGLVENEYAEERVLPEEYFFNQQNHEYQQESFAQQNNCEPYTSMEMNVDTIEQTDPIYTSANILHGSENMDFVNMDDVVIIGDFSTTQVISRVEDFENTLPDRSRAVMMTIGDLRDNVKCDYNEHSDPEGSMSRGSSHLNIRSDERMPPRGELSGQESMGGASDITWNRLQYQEGSSRMSNTYNLIGRESWDCSNSNSVDSPSIPRRNSTPESSYHDDLENEQDTPTIIGYSGPPLNFRCPTCGEDFATSKERKEHELQRHPERKRETLIGSDIGKKKVKKLIVKKSDISKTEPNFDVFTNKLKQESTTVEQEIDIKDNREIDIDQSETKANVDLNKIMKGSVKAVCSICDCVLENAKALKQHKHEAHQEISKLKNRCSTCNEVFTNEYNFREHLKIHPLECRLCGKLFYRKQNIQLHMKRHLGLKPYKCEICQKCFVTRQKHDEHKNIHTGETPIKCSLCDEKFRRHSNLVQHRNRHHYQMKKKLKDYICQCGEIFHSKKKLAWHKEIHEGKPKACTKCSEKFLHMSSLTRHMRRAHNKQFLPEETRINENVECPICKRTFLKSSLDYHIKTHSGERPYQCIICNKDFTTKWNLKLHKWTHASRTSKPFKCDQCKGAFIRESDYIAHMNSHKSVRPYTCNYCGAQFIRKYNCLRHVKEHESNKKFTCNVCGKTFHRSYYLKDHMRVHSGVRPYTCHICGKTSTTKSNHNKHVQIHHAREPVSTEN